MCTNQIYIKYLFIIKIVLVLIGLSSIGICLRKSFISTHKLNIYDNTLQKTEIREGNTHFTKTTQDSLQVVNIK
jgi:hypothetical protein